MTKKGTTPGGRKYETTRLNGGSKKFTTVDDNNRTFYKVTDKKRPSAEFNFKERIFGNHHTRINKGPTKKK